jgi:hypothetical protein
MKPPDDLREWGKRALIAEVERLRAVTREAGVRVGDDARGASTSDPIIGGSPHGRGDALIDARAAVLLESVEVVLIDTKRPGEAVAMLLTLAGRINYSDDRVTHAYLFGGDGAAGIVAELVQLAQRASSIGGEDGMRFAADFKVALEQRMGSAP